LPPLPERTTTGISRVFGFVFSARQKNRPSTTGIATSRTITSGRFEAMRPCASATLRASSISMSMISKVVRRSTSSPGSSSTSSIRSGRVPGTAADSAGRPFPTAERGLAAWTMPAAVMRSPPASFEV
jgi:hypothetical protein